MFRVIKGAIYEEEKVQIAVPGFGKKASQDDAEDADEAQGLDAEAQEHLLANIREKELRADQMIKDAQIASEIMKQDAQAQAGRILETAQEQAAQLQEEARQQGYEAGIQEGRQAGAEQIKQEQHQIIVDANAKAERTLAKADAAIQDYFVEAENEIAEMVLRIADKVLPQHFIDVPQLILPLVRAAIQKVKDQPHVKVRVCPDAYELVLMAQSEFQAELEGNAALEVCSDEALKIGDCIVESPNGTIDAKLSTQLELVKQAVRNVMK